MIVERVIDKITQVQFFGINIRFIEYLSFFKLFVLNTVLHTSTSKYHLTFHLQDLGFKYGFREVIEYKNTYL